MSEKSERLREVRSYTFLSLALFALCGVLWIGMHGQKDFQQDYFALQAWAQGSSVYGEEVTALGNGWNGRGIPNYHPPTTLVLLLPLLVFSYPVAYWLFAITAVVWATLLIRQCARMFPLASISPAIAVSLFLFWPPFLFGVYQANPSVLVALAGLQIFFLLIEKRRVATGIMVGLSTALKLYPIFLLIWFLARREYKTAFAAVGFFLTVVFASWFIFGSADWWRYISTVAVDTHRLFGTARGNLAISGLVLPWFAGGELIQPVVNAAWIGYALVAAISALTAIAVLAISIPKRPNAEDEALVVGILYLAVTLLSPVSWQPALVTLVLPILVLASRYSRMRRGRSLVVLVLLCVGSCMSLYDVALHEYLAAGKVGLDPWRYFFLTKMQGVASLAIGFLMVRELRSSSRETINPPVANRESRRRDLRTNILLSLVAACTTLTLCYVVRLVVYSVQIFNHSVRKPSPAQGRLFDPDLNLGIVPAPNGFGTMTLSNGDPFAVRFDERGLRIPIDQVETNLRSPALLFIGDSFTFGYGVPAEAAFPARVGAALNLDTANGGVPAYGYTQMLGMLKRKIDQQRPQRVIFQISPWLPDRSTSRHLPSAFYHQPRSRLCRDVSGSIHEVAPNRAGVWSKYTFTEFTGRLPDFSTLVAFTLKIGAPLRVSLDRMYAETFVGDLLNSCRRSISDDEVTEYVARQAEAVTRKAGIPLSFLILNYAGEFRHVSFRQESTWHVIDASLEVANQGPEPASEDDGMYLRLYGIWDQDRTKLIDHHPNPDAHKIIAERVSQALRSHPR